MTTQEAALRRQSAGRLAWPYAAVVLTVGIGLVASFDPLTLDDLIRLCAVALAAFGILGVSLTSVRGGVGAALAAGKLGPWACVGFIPAWGLSTLTWKDRRSSAIFINETSILRACAIAGIAFAAFVVGYLLVVRAAPRLGSGAALGRLLGTFPKEAVNYKSALFIYGLGLAAHLLQILSGGYGYQAVVGVAAGPDALTQPISVLAGFLYFGIAALTLAYLNAPSIPGLATISAASACGITLGLLSGGKESPILVVVALALGYGAHRGRLPKVPLLLASIVLIFFLQPFVQAYRDELNKVRGYDVSAAQIALNVPDRLDISPSSATLSARQLLGRVREIDNVAVIAQRTPSEIPYIGSSEIVTAPLAGVIPRAIWPSKPIYNGPTQFTVEYFNMSATSASAITPIGDLYRRGGLVVVGAGMLLIGLALRTIDDAYDTRESIGGLFLTLSLFPTVVKWEAGVVGVLMGVTTLLAAPAIAVRLMSRSS